MIKTGAVFIFSCLFLCSEIIVAQEIWDSDVQFETEEIDCSIFIQDKFWRGADGAATIDLENGKILWLFSDTFINTSGGGKREGSVMINNSIAVQEGNDLGNSKLRFYWKGTEKNPEAFFKLPGETWFWTGHGTVLDGKLLVFLFEEKSTTTGLGFETVGWSLVIIDNPNDNPDKWNMKYVKGPETFGVIAGSSAVLKDEDYVYTFGVKEPGTHETYLLRFKNEKIWDGDLSEIEWWVNDRWEMNISEEPKSSVLFISQTEFSVHFDRRLGKYLQIQTLGFGHSSLGFRTADRLQGPWSEPVVFYTPALKEKEFNYSAKAHPGLKSNGILITYNVNNFSFNELVQNENIYFPRLIKLKLKK